MTFPKARLAVAAALFFSWLGFLAYLAFTSSTIILSRPQFMIAQLYVVANIAKGDAKDTLNPNVTIDNVLWSARPSDNGLVGKVIALPELAACEWKQGSRGPGKYLLPLQRTNAGNFEIAPVPQSFHWNITLESYGIFSHRIRKDLSVEKADDLQTELEAAGHVVYVSHGDWSATHATLESFGVFSHRIRRRLPLQIARGKRLELKAAGQVVYMTPEEIRIYPWNSGAEAQLAPLLRAK